MLRNVSVKQWEKMSRKQRRIYICKDVIARINAGQLHIKHGSYVVDSQSDEVNYRKLFEEENIKELARHCEVCAKGAMFLCHLDRFDNFTPNEGDVIESYEFDITEQSTSYQLRDAFDRHQLDLIEVAFEKCDVLDRFTYYNDSNIGYTRDKIADEAIEFGNDFDDDVSRLLAIMQNVIDHNGTFVPSVRYKVEEVSYWEYA